MLKVLVLQKYHGRSDDEIKFQVANRFSFFCRSLVCKPETKSPDAQTIWDFRQILEKTVVMAVASSSPSSGKYFKYKGMLARRAVSWMPVLLQQRNSYEANAQRKSPVNC
jgi:hypothetical protein